MNENPYISFVVCGRNDEYGGNFLERLNTFIFNIDKLCMKYDLMCEIVLVEWNPPEDAPTFDKVIYIPKNNDFLKLNLIRVSNNIHNDVAHDSKLPLHEWYAKNVGMFRANGKYIVITNPDIIISEELFEELSRKNLRKDYFYRAIRKDVKPLARAVTLSLSEIQKHCKNNILRVHGFYGTEELTIDFFKLLKRQLRKLAKLCLPNYKLFTNAAGDFLLTHRDNFQRMAGYPERLKRSYIDGYACYLLFNQGLHEYVFEESSCIYHQDHIRPRAQGLIDYRIQLLKILYQKRTSWNSAYKWGLQEYELETIQL